MHWYTFGFLHSQFITDLFLVSGEMIQSFSQKSRLPQDLILIEQQFTVLIIHFVRGRLGKNKNINIK